MAHYAFIDENNIVQNVTVGIDENDTSELPEGYETWEEYYTFVMGMTCKRTSYNTFANVHTDNGTAFRGNYAGIGYTYDTENDVFIPPKPYSNWILDTSTWTWEAPTDMPDLTQEQIDNGSRYIWNETTASWDLTTP